MLSFLPTTVVNHIAKYHLGPWVLANQLLWHKLEISVNLEGREESLRKAVRFASYLRVVRVVCRTLLIDIYSDRRDLAVLAGEWLRVQAKIHPQNIRLMVDGNILLSLQSMKPFVNFLCEDLEVPVEWFILNRTESALWYLLDILTYIRNFKIIRTETFFYLFERTVPLEYSYDTGCIHWRFVQAVLNGMASGKVVVPKIIQIRQNPEPICSSSFEVLQTNCLVEICSVLLVDGNLWAQFAGLRQERFLFDRVFVFGTCYAEWVRVFSAISSSPEITVQRLAIDAYRHADHVRIAGDETNELASFTGE